MVTDAQVIQDYYLARHNTPSTMIAYGSEVERRPDRAAVRKWRVEPNRYVLYVSRLEPENNAHLVIEAFKKVRTAYRLLIVGDAPYAESYIKSLKAQARGDKRIIFTGFVFGQDYRALQQNAYCYVHATEVGGTHPALLEAMGYGNCVLTLATPENIEVVGEAGVPYIDEYDLAAKLQRVLRDGSLVQAYRNRAQQRVESHYDWETVVDQYEQLFARMIGQTVRTEDDVPETPEPAEVLPKSAS
jgi:glycosyltransferase involved in cell wall biosynthesis